MEKVYVKGARGVGLQDGLGDRTVSVCPATVTGCTSWHDSITDIYFLTVPGARRLRSRYQRHWVLLRAVRETHSSPLPSLLGPSANFWHSVVGKRVTPNSAFIAHGVLPVRVAVSKCLSFIRTLVLLD